MSPLRIDFCDFWPGFNKTDNYLYRLMARHFPVQVCDQPDFVFYSHGGDHHKLYGGTKIFYSAEIDTPTFKDHDFSISPLPLDDERHLRMPPYVWSADPSALIKTGEDPETILRQKSRFCCFIVSYHNPRKTMHRVRFFEELSKYKKVDSGGRLMNNIGGPIAGGFEGKREFMRNYKFTICFENVSVPGYTSEKIVDAMQARCLPIYYGNPGIDEEFNPKSFLNWFDFSSEKDLIERVIALDQDDSLYLQALKEPYFNGNTPNRFFQADEAVAWLDRVFSGKLKPSRPRDKKLWGRWQLARADKPPTPL